MSDLFSLPIPLSEQEQQILNQMSDENFRFSSVYDFIKTAKIVDFWPDEKALSYFLCVFLKQDFGLWEDENEELELPLGIYWYLYGRIRTDKTTESITYNSQEQEVYHEKMAFLLSLFKDLNFLTLYVSISDDIWTEKINFYITKILLRNPSISLYLYLMPNIALYKNSEIQNYIHQQFHQCLKESKKSKKKIDGCLDCSCSDSIHNLEKVSQEFSKKQKLL